MGLPYYITDRTYPYRFTARWHTPNNDIPAMRLSRINAVNPPTNMLVIPSMFRVWSITGIPTHIIIPQSINPSVLWCKKIVVIAEHNKIHATAVFVTSKIRSSLGFSEQLWQKIQLSSMSKPKATMQYLYIILKPDMPRWITHSQLWSYIEQFIKLYLFPWNNPSRKWDKD